MACKVQLHNHAVGILNVGKDWVSIISQLGHVYSRAMPPTICITSTSIQLSFFICFSFSFLYLITLEWGAFLQFSHFPYSYMVESNMPVCTYSLESVPYGLT